MRLGHIAADPGPIHWHTGEMPDKLSQFRRCPMLSKKFLLRQLLGVAFSTQICRQNLFQIHEAMAQPQERSF
jgi:hypothetical protein